MISDAGLWALFASAFAASTLLPVGSEALLIYLASDPSYEPLELLLVATAGNTLGGMTTWGIGWLLAGRLSFEKLRRDSHRHAVKRLREWGAPGLLFSWVPVVGDPLCLAAGWLRISPLVSGAYIGTGKLLRYAVLLVAVQ